MLGNLLSLAAMAGPLSIDELSSKWVDPNAIVSAAAGLEGSQRDLGTGSR